MLTVDYTSGTINVSGGIPVGLQANTEGIGTSTVTTAPRTVIRVSDPQTCIRGRLLTAVSSGGDKWRMFHRKSQALEGRRPLISTTTQLVFWAWLTRSETTVVLLG